jgi:hypothetical protein
MDDGEPLTQWPMFCECGDGLWTERDVARHRKGHRDERLQSIQKHGLCPSCDLGMLTACTCPK